MKYFKKFDFMKLLLLTTGLNNDKNSSWLVFKKFIKLMRSECSASIDVICFTPSFKKSEKSLDEKTYTTFFRNELLAALFNRISRNNVYWIANIYARLYSMRIIKQIKKNKTEILWVYTDILTMLILKRVLKKISIPFHLTVFDDPFTNKYYEPFQHKINPLIKDLFKQAKSIDTPTLLIADHYRANNYLNSTCKIAESLVGTFKVQPNKPIIRNKIRRIGMAGSLSGLDALNKFLEALGDMFENYGIEFHLITRVSNIYLKYIDSKYPAINKHAIIKPFISEQELPAKLQEYDLLYIPMLFDEKYRFQTNTSFPSKTHNYLASGIPIIVHTPESSSLNQFFLNNKIGFLINTLNSDSIKQSFNQILSKEYRKILSNDIQVFNTSHLKNKHVEKLFKVINSNYLK